MIPSEARYRIAEYDVATGVYLGYLRKLESGLAQSTSVDPSLAMTVAVMGNPGGPYNLVIDPAFRDFLTVDAPYLGLITQSPEGTKADPGPGSTTYLVLGGIREATTPGQVPTGSTAGFSGGAYSETAVFSIDPATFGLTATWTLQTGEPSKETVPYYVVEGSNAPIFSGDVDALRALAVGIQLRPVRFVLELFVPQVVPVGDAGEVVN